VGELEINIYKLSLSEDEKIPTRFEPLLRMETTDETELFEEFKAVNAFTKNIAIYSYLWVNFKNWQTRLITIILY
jgi:hypothetical protein